MSRAAYREGYAEAQRAYLIGRAVRDDRISIALDADLIVEIAPHAA